MEASEESSATPIAPLKPPVFALLRKQATPDTSGPSKDSMIILSSGPVHLKFVSTWPIRSPHAGKNVHVKIRKARFLKTLTDVTQ